MRAKVPYQKKKKRLGRGIGSGVGKTCGRGHKGQKSRSGVSMRAGFEGGQNPLYRRLPKRGFNHAAFKREYAVINLESLNRFADQAEITPDFLKKQGVIKKRLSGIKILGQGELKKPLTIQAHRFSGSAKAKIEKAGGKAVVIS